MATKKKPGAVNKTRFVLAHPGTMPASEVVKRGKDQGIELTEAYVYSVRSKARGNNGAGKPKRRAAASNGSSVRREAFEGMEPDLSLVKVRVVTQAEQDLRPLIVRHGTIALRRALEVAEQG